MLRITFGDGLKAALDREPRRPCAPDGAAAGQAPPPEGRADRPATNVDEEASVITSEVQNGPAGPGVEPVDLETLVCPGCAEPVAGQPPLGWPAQAGEAPGFSHADGSVLCPDSAGRIDEPVELDGLRYGLTDAGAHALDSDAGAIAAWTGAWS